MSDSTDKPEASPAAPKARPGYLVLSASFLVFGAGGLALLPVATQSGPGHEGWYTQPWLTPAIALVIMTLAAAAGLALQIYRMRAGLLPRFSAAAILGELGEWARPLEFYVYYALYIWLLSIVGYGLSTLAFVLGLSLRTGLRGRRWVLTTTVVMVLLFRLGLKIWMPSAKLYSLFPNDIRSFLIRFF